ncbi:MAG: diaminopimelate epimerase [Acetobacteraceae bacterium]|nr:diaminopimelate epimerase [Acetobacteraceae bacterium]
MTPFRKMHFGGNDFVVLDGRAGRLPISQARAAAIADRRTGVGFDQLLLIEAADGADAYLRILNADGSEAEACGNGTRCVAGLLMAESGRGHAVIRTLAGELMAESRGDGLVAVDMGPVRLGWRDVPLARELDTLHLPLARDGLPQPVHDPAACSMGNPHVTFFVDDVKNLPVEALGHELEHDPLFPQRANIGFAEILAPHRLKLRVWERGAGETRACGSGACAAVVNAARRKLTAHAADVLLPGGTLHIHWRADGHVVMTGPWMTAFEGRLDLDAYPL